jgi:hypothetical protein
MPILWRCNPAHINPGTDLARGIILSDCAVQSKLLLLEPLLIQLCAVDCSRINASVTLEERKTIR